MAELKKCMVKKSVTEERVFLWLVWWCSPSTVRGPQHFRALGGEKLLNSGQQGMARNKREEGWPRNKLIPSKMMPQGTTCLQPVSTSQAPFR